MALDVGDRFAQRQREHGLDLGRKRHGRGRVVEANVSRLEQQTRRRQLGANPGGADAGHCASHLAERVACDLLDVDDLAARRQWIAVEQLYRKFRFERDQRQCMAEQVVQVAPDAFALRERGETQDFVLAPPQRHLLLAGVGRVDGRHGEQQHGYQDADQRLPVVPAQRGLDRKSVV